MKTLIIFTIVICSLVVLTGCAAPPTPSLPSAIPESLTPPSAPSKSLTEAYVARVIDGDTIEVDIGGRLYKVRYIGIDTPEIGQYGGDVATFVNAELVAGRTVYLEKDVSETDRYGRLLRYVWTEEGMVNALLVSMAYAQVTTYPPDVKYQQEFLELQRQAQEASLGLWATPQPMPAVEGLYVGSINSNKYHYPQCRYAKQIYPENEVWFSSTAEAQAMGYVPCKVCQPPVTD